MKISKVHIETAHENPCYFCGLSLVEAIFILYNFPIAPRSTKVPMHEKSEFKIGKCKNCHLIQKISKSDTKVLYEEFKNDIIGNKLSQQKTIFSKYIQAELSKNFKVAEIGSGNGQIIKKLANDNPESSFIANDYNLSFKNNHKNLIKISGDLHNYKIDKIDLFFSSHVFEHIENIQEHINYVYNSLNYGGKYLIAIPLFEEWIKNQNLNSFSQEHPIYPFEVDLDYLFESYGFKKCNSSKFLDHSLFVTYEKTNQKLQNLHYFSKSSHKSKIIHLNKFVERLNLLKNLLLKVSKRHKKIVIWGANTSTQVLISLLDELYISHKNLMIVDNSNLKIGGYLFGTDIKIKSPSEISNLTSEDSVIIMLGVFDDEVVEQCQKINPDVTIYTKKDI